jgi:hypothetical protein
MTSFDDFYNLWTSDKGVLGDKYPQRFGGDWTKQEPFPALRCREFRRNDCFMAP